MTFIRWYDSKTVVLVPDTATDIHILPNHGQIMPNHGKIMLNEGKIMLKSPTHPPTIMNIYITSLYVKSIRVQRPEVLNRV